MIRGQYKMKKVATPGRTQSVTPRKLLQNTIANGPKKKQKPITCQKKEVAEDVAKISEEVRRAPEEFVAEDVPENHVVSEDVGKLI